MHASMAGVLSAIGLSMSKQGIGAALAYTINARFLVPKSWISTILLPHILEFNINAAAEKIARIAEILGKNTEGLTSVEAAKSAVEAIRRLIGSLKLPMRLRDFDLKLDEMIEISSVARSYDMMNYLPRMASAEELYDIIKTAY
jgi:alcohol dehydrogenase